jgi:outer membrane murein-binding lipoprotein Lpp
MKKLIAVPLIALFGVFALSGSALTASGCSNSKPEFCSDVENLKGSINTINQVQTDFEAVQRDADAAVQSAREDFPQESQSLEDSINNTRDAIEGLPSSPSTEQYIALGVQVVALGTAAKDFQDAASSACN